MTPHSLAGAAFVVSIIAVLISAFSAVRNSQNNRAQTTLVVYREFLEGPQITPARQRFYGPCFPGQFPMRNRPFLEWNTDDRDAASRLCRHYDFVGYLIREGLVLDDYVSRTWYLDIVTIYENDGMRGYLADIRGNHYQSLFSNFNWLYYHVRELRDHPDIEATRLS